MLRTIYFVILFDQIITIVAPVFGGPSSGKKGIYELGCMPLQVGDAAFRDLGLRFIGMYCK